MRIARSPAELERLPRAVALGTFDGVHLGHRRVLETTRAEGRRPTVVTFDPHPRTALGNRVELLTTLERRLELTGELGIEDALVVAFDLDLARLSPEAFAERILRPIGTELVVTGPDFRFGHGRRGDPELLRQLGFEVRIVEPLEGVSSTRVRTLLGEGAVDRAAVLLGRPHELDGVVVSGDARGGTLGYPTANLAVIPELLVPAYGIYAGEVGEHRAAISIGTNPHYGGHERRIESFLLDFEGDLYGARLIVQLWCRLREERVFGSEAELIEQIGRDVAAARAAIRPA
ncbi:MAG: riboflavin biosynthesis protein RibF [Actinobacteria bacterium]|nr:riboflavin biosynthesis protein RibF [Actinomycetota bacterium]